MRRTNYPSLSSFCLFRRYQDYWWSLWMLILLFHWPEKYDQKECPRTDRDWSCLMWWMDRLISDLAQASIFLIARECSFEARRIGARPRLYVSSYFLFWGGASSTSSISSTTNYDYTTQDEEEQQQPTIKQPLCLVSLWSFSLLVWQIQNSKQEPLSLSSMSGSNNNSTTTTTLAVAVVVTSLAVGTISSLGWYYYFTRQYQQQGDENDEKSTIIVVTNEKENETAEHTWIW